MATIKYFKTRKFWVDLTHTFDPEIPRFSEFEKGEVSTLFTVKIMVSMCNVGIL